MEVVNWYIEVVKSSIHVVLSVPTRRKLVHRSRFLIHKSRKSVHRSRKLFLKLFTFNSLKSYILLIRFNTLYK